MLYNFGTNTINPGSNQLAYMRGDMCWHVGQLFSCLTLFTFMAFIKKEKMSAKKEKASTKNSNHTIL